jgi:hypothetical protein
VPKPLGGELDAADLRRGDDVAGDADDEEVAEPLVEDELGRHARVGAAEDDGERLLAGGELAPARLAGEGVEAADVGGEAAVALAQAFERLARGDHCCGRLVRARAASRSAASASTHAHAAASG